MSSTPYGKSMACLPGWTPIIRYIEQSWWKPYGSMKTPRTEREKEVIIRFTIILMLQKPLYGLRPYYISYQSYHLRLTYFDSLTYFQLKHSQQVLSMHISLHVCVICYMMSELDGESLLGTSELVLTHHPLPAALQGLSPAEWWVIESCGRRSKASNPWSPHGGLNVHQTYEHACKVTAGRHAWKPRPLLPLFSGNTAEHFTSNKWVGGECSQASSDGPSASQHCFQHLFHGLCLHIMMSILCLSPKGEMGIVLISAMQKKKKKKD